MDHSTTGPGPLTSHLAPSDQTSGAHTHTKGIHLGRERVKWGHEVWDRIDRAVQHEFHRTRVLGRFLPHHRVDPHVTTVPADTVLSSIGGLPMGVPGAAIAAVGAGVAQTAPLLNIDEGAITRLIETWVEFSMTPQQVEQENQLHKGHHEHHEHHHDHHEHHTSNLEIHGQHDDTHHKHHEHHVTSTAVTLASRAANTLCMGEDTVLLQGQIAFQPLASGGSGLFANDWVLNRGIPADYGLLCVGPTTTTPSSNLPGNQVIEVTQVVPPSAPFPQLATYSYETVTAINEAYSILQANGHYGPYACVLYYYPYADSFAPLPTTLILPADRINPLMTRGYYGTGTMPGTPTTAITNPAPSTPVTPSPPLPNPTNANTQSMGLVVSLGGNTMDLVIGQDPVTAFMQQDPDGNFRFRVFERYALRLKDMSAVVRLEFQ